MSIDETRQVYRYVEIIIFSLTNFSLFFLSQAVNSPLYL